MVEVQAVRRDARLGRYCPIPPHFAEYETSRGLCVDLPPVLTYEMQRLLTNPDSSNACLPCQQVMCFERVV